MTLLDNDSNVVVRPNARIDDEAIDWVERSDRETWTDENQQELDAWLEGSTARRVAYLRIKDGWTRADRLIALRGTFGPPRPADRNRHWAVSYKAAAGVLITAALIVSWFGLQSRLARYDTYATIVGGHKLLTLEDGSQIELNTDTQIRTHFDTGHRTVWVDRGEAYFQIVHNQARPFSVFANQSRITDIGTKFVVQTSPQEIRVSLIEGKAAVDMPANPQVRSKVLVPGNVAIATAHGVSVVDTSRQSVEEELSWRRGVLILNQSTLADAAAQMNRYNLRKIIIADPDAARQRIDGTFPANNVDVFGRVAKNVLGLHVASSGADLVISR